MTPEQADKLIESMDEARREAAARDQAWSRVVDRLDERMSQINQVLIEIRELIPEQTSSGGEA